VSIAAGAGTEVTEQVAEAPLTLRARAAAFYQLTKPGITRHILVTTAAGFYMAAPVGGLDIILLLHMLIGTALASSGTLGLNQYMEREIDALMDRTRGRPLPSGRIRPGEALAFATALAIGGLGYQALFVNWTAALITAATLISYIFIYTPLKRRTSLNTLVGAVPGALPILAGWTATGRGADLGGWILFAIMFLWQIPHFLALAWLYRVDYRAGGFVMLSAVDPDGRRTSRQIVNYAAMLLPVSLLPSAIGMTGSLYFTGALLLGLAFLLVGLKTLTTNDDLWSRRLFFTSVIYLPLVQLLMVFGKVGG
jgi:protoheme IX farnesyltransferase